MKQKVKVMIKSDGNSAVLQNENGLEWTFKCPKSSTVLGDNFTAVSSLASALLTITISRWIEISKAGCVCFTLSAEDIF